MLLGQEGLSQKALSLIEQGGMMSMTQVLVTIFVAMLSQELSKKRAV